MLCRTVCNFTSDRWIQPSAGQSRSEVKGFGNIELATKVTLLRQLYLQIVNGHGQDSVGSLAGVRPTSGLNISCVL